ncbi:MAG: hypothetical protein ABI343_01250 [Burkholderiaceae bacterium]
MNRCSNFFRRFAFPFALAVLSGSLLVPYASAQTEPISQVPGVRPFPATAKRGMLVVTAPPQVTINGVAERLSPGVRIRGVDNGLVMSATLVGKPVIVNYVRENQGLIREVWILNQAEADQKRSGMEPTINFSFESMGDKPKVDDGKTPFNQLPKFPKQ